MKRMTAPTEGLSQALFTLLLFTGKTNNNVIMEVKRKKRLVDFFMINKTEPQ